MTIIQACNEINKLCALGSINSGDLTFKGGVKASLFDIKSFENKFKINIPDEYKQFLQKVGAVSLYMDEYGLGFEFIPLDRLAEFSDEVFLDMDNPFPNLLIIASNTARGAFIAYCKKRDTDTYGLSIFFGDEDPESWIDDIDSWTTLSEWLSQLINSNGEEDLI